VILPSEIAAVGYRLWALDETGSTNQDAMNAGRSGDPGMLWVTAREQKAGRGRHGRTWSSPAGNLYASLLLVDPCDLAVAPQLGFVAGLALHDAVSSVTGTVWPDLALKWPNDLLLGGAKVSGLLLEAQVVSPEKLAIVIGFGVNVAEAPSNTHYRAAALTEVNSTASLEALFCGLTDAFDRYFTAWRSVRASGSDAFSPVREAWLARAAALGQEVGIRIGSRRLTGVFVGLDPVGRLLLETGEGLETIDAGDLFWPSLSCSSDASQSSDEVLP
jgi:BirA family transcriptional regulator, biotin operon repressor / biotin---[acetyl-CoA-carboxylase] ligase